MKHPAIPDPTEDLHWSDYKGPITDYLTKHASEDADRLCVCETSPRRDFSYGTINSAATLLAHYLLNRGVSRGDVVMLYSARCVELVVAYMGVLRAGATVSVLDPQYPPDRQIVYLDVARPRAIVTIKKAAESAGGFQEKVSSWINGNLELKARIPELSVNDNGTLSGGLLEDNDILKDVSPRDLPVVGPDDIPTLSFTSGSEGKPKGVRGRHFSLTQYFPWMAERFDFSKNDRFTMLSGIAHDPIQRDIFTPIFLGASVWIPAFEDIAHTRLGEWMLEHETTVTVLTPAMGQIMIGGSPPQFPSLRSAFLVGDVLHKRDVGKLQELAPNATVVNMFGTTETQRAVSYYAVPNRNSDPGHLATLPDYIPAGKGMDRVQLLVVDMQDKHRICAPDEQGEIYVRAAGLSEGYLREDELNKQKFLENWFVEPERWLEDDARRAHNEPWRKYYKGPRDRLYRSGDIGKYDQQGNVYCTGRIDNQIKIRGFRVELNDIDAKLASHPLVELSVTTFRKEIEQITSFVVPARAEWEKLLDREGLRDETGDDSMVGLLKRFHLLRTEIRNFLKTKLATHEIPALIVPLLKMPLNPNGKPDRPKLPYPTKDDLNAARASTGTQLTPTQMKVAEIWSKVLGIDADNMNPDDSWTDLGGDSLKALTVLTEVRKDMRNVQQRDLYSHPSLGAFASICDPDASTNGINGTATFDYAADAEQLSLDLANVFEAPSKSPSTVLLTGATGFLGSFILDNLLRRSGITKVFCVIRGGSGRQRLKDAFTAYGLDWVDSKVECVPGDLSKPWLGLENLAWNQLCEQVDSIVHNGARVDWLLNYHDLRSTNVGSTMAILELACTGNPKRVAFVSSTAVLGTQAFADQTVSEDDDLVRSRYGLDEGYGQTKWVSEYLMREAGRRGLAGSIIRAGYILGDSKRGGSVTDDFLIRMLVGSIQVKASPPITNPINMVPVDYVSRLVSAAAACQASEVVKPGVSVLQVMPGPQTMSWQSFLQAPAAYGYHVDECRSYEDWRDLVLSYVDEHKDWAALPLLDLITSDFPSSTAPRYLDNAKAKAVMQSDNGGSTLSQVDQGFVGLYLSYLTTIGFVARPPSDKAGSPLPTRQVTDEQWKALAKLEGRGKIGTNMHLNGHPATA